jgi:hypothetical protein
MTTLLIQAVPWQQMLFPENHERRTKVEEELLRLARESSKSADPLHSSLPVLEEEVFVPPSSPDSPQQAVSLPPPAAPSVSTETEVSDGNDAILGRTIHRQDRVESQGWQLNQRNDNGSILQHESISISDTDSQEKAQPRSVAGGSQVKAGGKACAPCGADHFSTAAGLLPESVRFAHRDGLESDEVIRRLDKVFRELNAFEREDGAPENIVKLPEDEKVLMRKLMDQSRGLRHQLTDVKSIDDLEAAAAQAEKMSLGARTQVFKMRLRRAREEARV